MKIEIENKDSYNAKREVSHRENSFRMKIEITLYKKAKNQSLDCHRENSFRMKIEIKSNIFRNRRKVKSQRK